MDKLVIYGGKPLAGQVETSGSKNAALALMAASLLPASGKTIIHRVPDLRDVHTLANLLRIIGARVDYEDHTLTISAANVSHFEAPYELVKKNACLNLRSWSPVRSFRACSCVATWRMRLWTATSGFAH